MDVLKRTALVLLAVVLVAGCRMGQEQWGPFRGQVVDAETGKPIAGANVMVLWIREPPNFHYTEWFYDAQETVTDGEGRFELPHKTRILTAFVRGPEISVFSPGYLMQEPDTPPESRPYVDSTVVPMRPLRTREEKCKYAWGGPLADTESTVPRLMEALHEYNRALKCGDFVGAPR